MTQKQWLKVKKHLPEELICEINNRNDPKEKKLKPLKIGDDVYALSESFDGGKKEGSIINNDSVHMDYKVDFYNGFIGYYNRSSLIIKKD